MERVQLKIKTVHKHNDTFYTGILHFQNIPYQYTSQQLQHRGATILADVQRSYSSRYGDQFKILSSISYVTDETVFLKLSSDSQLKDIYKAYSGLSLGKVRLKRILQPYLTGDGALENINNILRSFQSNDQLSLLINSQEFKDRMITCLLEISLPLLIAQELKNFAVTLNSCIALAKQLGENSINIIKNNPYSLIGIVKGFGFKTCDKMAMANGLPRDSYERLRACVLFLLKQLDKDGHTHMNRNHLIALSTKELEGQYIDTDFIDRLQREGLIVKSGEDILLYDVYVRMKFISENIRTRSQYPIRVIDCNFANLNLTEEQQNACHNMKNNAVSIVMGEAGTGKSYTISKLIQRLKSVGATFKIGAPTGMAARRLQEDGIPATTIHSALGYSPHVDIEVDVDEEDDTGYGTTPIYPTEDFFIVDESSMLTDRLVEVILQRVALTSRIVFIGDANQIPPIGAGTFFATAIRLKLLPTAILSQSKRQSGELGINAGLLLAGHLKEANGKIMEAVSQWITLRATSGDVVSRFLIPAYQKCTSRFGSNQYGAKINNVQILAHTKELCQHSNELIREYLIGTSQIQDIGERFYINERIILNKTIKILDRHIVRRTSGAEYDESAGRLIIRNGMQGFCIGFIDRHFRFEMLDGTQFELPKGHKELIRIAPAHCVTIHKIQGSAAKSVIYLGLFSILMNKNSIYTALTRATDLNVILGDFVKMNNQLHVDAIESRRYLLPSMIDYRISANEEQLSLPS